MRLAPICFLLPVLLAGRSGEPAESLALSEILPAPDHGRELCPGGDEYVELVNTGPEAVDLAGYALAGPTGRSRPLVSYEGPWRHGSPGMILPPGGVALVTTTNYSGRWHDYINRHANISGLRHLTVAGARLLGNGLSDNGGIVLLVKDDGTQVDSLAWTSCPGTDVSLERTSPGDAATYPVCRFFGGTPGVATVPVAGAGRRRVALERRVVRRGEPAFVRLRLDPGERAELFLLARDGRRLLTIAANFRHSGTSLVPVAPAADNGQPLAAGTYLVVAAVTRPDGGTDEATVCLQIAPRLR